jgi:hypothetical protein
MTATRSLRGTRRALALAFSDGPRTMNEAARALGKPAGAVYGIVQRMLVEGLLVADSDPPTRGTLYELAAAAQPLLDATDEQEQPIGSLSEGQRLLRVEGDLATVKVQRLFAQRALFGSVAWVAEIDGGHGLLLAMLADTNRSDVQRLAVAFNEAGLRSSHSRISELFGSKELRAEAVSALDLAESLDKS